MNMRLSYTLSLLLLFFTGMTFGQSTDSTKAQTFDIVHLKDGSRLSGKIVSWDLEKGMEFKLVTGASIYINKEEIDRVEQDTEELPNDRFRRYRRPFVPRPYAFRETGWYHNSSGFFNISTLGGVGLHHAMGYRFSRLFGVGLGTGIETNDFSAYRKMIPVYAEVRGFLLPKKISPYYAVKLGYAFGLRDEINGTLGAKGGLLFSPELGVRFGAGDVNYYLGVEYKLQNATFIWNGWDWTGGTRVEDKISYRRFELRTGLLF
jgi:hypothetical protein